MRSSFSAGRLLPLSIVVAAIGIGVFAIWYQHRQMHRVIAALSGRVAEMIIHAPGVELLKLRPHQNDEGATLTLHGTQYDVVGDLDISGVRGLTNVRAGLVHDLSYDWTEPLEAATTWQYVLVFRDEVHTVRLAIDVAGQRLMLLDNGPILSIPPIAAGLGVFFDEQFSDRRGSM